MFFLQLEKKDKIRPKRWYPMLVFLSKNTKQHNFVFCGSNQHFVSFFTSVFANSKNHHPLFRFISSKRRVSFKQRFAIPKHAYVFWELFTILVAFYPQNVSLVVPWTDVIMRQNTAHLENRKACKNFDLALHHSQFLQTWRVCFAL